MDAGGEGGPGLFSSFRVVGQDLELGELGAIGVWPGDVAVEGPGAEDGAGGELGGGFGGPGAGVDGDAGDGGELRRSDCAGGFEVVAAADEEEAALLGEDFGRLPGPGAEAGAGGGFGVGRGRALGDGDGAGFGFALRAEARREVGGQQG